MKQITKADIYKLLGIVKITYPFNFRDFGKDEYQNLVTSWFDVLKDYPKELVEAAFNEVRKTNTIGITPADIIKQLGKFNSAAHPSDFELWEKMQEILSEVGFNYWAIENRYSVVEDNGKTQYANALEEVNRIFENMPSILKAYCVNVKRLLQMSQWSDSQTEYEKNRFLRLISEFKDRLEIQAKYPELLEQLTREELPGEKKELLKEPDSFED